jgi:hypothetical protein
MFVIRMLVLIVLTALSFSMGQTPSNQLNGFGSLFSLSFFLFATVLYFYPMYEAYIHKQPNFYSIFALNLFLGWTLIGWVVALVWAVKSNKPIKTVSVTSPENKKPSLDSSKPLKQCQFCAEDVLIAAKRCKHCGSDI